MRTSAISNRNSKGDCNHKYRREILYNGYFYDVTEFAARHPGGNIIKFYTEFGEDASQAIQQFHYRSMGKVDNIMKSLSKRAPSSQECGNSKEELWRHQLLSADFNDLFEQLQLEGYFQPSLTHVMIRLLDAFGLLVFTLGCYFYCQTTSSKHLAAVACGFAMSRFGWLTHEAGHNSLSGSPKVDKILQVLVFDFMLGISSRWWNSQHNRHHAMPMRLEHDVDLATLPFVAFHRKAVKDRREISHFFVKYQAVLYLTLDTFIVSILWRFYLHPRYQLNKRAYFEMAISIPNLYFMLFIVGPLWYFVMVYWGALFMGINFALSHTYLDVAEKPTHWIEYSFIHTANIKPSLFVDYIMGYLNYQIEHHLFPAMPQFRQRQISHRVKALAEKHGLPYHVYDYNDACKLAIKNLNRVGKELTSTES